MDIEKLETLPPPPGVFGSLKAGFDIVSSRVALILIPLTLDLFLWLGPRLGVEGLLLPSITYLSETYIAQQKLTGSSLELFMQNQELLLERLQDFNLVSLLSKSYWFPVGIHSLSAQSLPVTNPLGLQNVVTVSSVWVLLGLAAVLIPLGWVVGGVFFRARGLAVAHDLKPDFLQRLLDLPAFLRRKIICQPILPPGERDRTGG